MQLSSGNQPVAHQLSDGNMLNVTMHDATRHVCTLEAASGINPLEDQSIARKSAQSCPVPT